jgi:hypothetical protein
MRLLTELKYFWYQLVARYERQRLEAEYSHCARRVQGLKLKTYSFDQCLLAAARLRGERNQWIGPVASLLFSRTARGNVNLETAMERFIAGMEKDIPAKEEAKR